MGLQSLHVGWLWLIVSGFCSCTAHIIAEKQHRGGFFCSFMLNLSTFLYVVSQPVEDQGVHIPDQTVIKKGKQCSPGYHACFCLPPHPPRPRTHTRASHSAWENTMQCGNAWLILIRSSLFFITWFPSASKLAAPFFPLADGIYCQRFGAAARDERRRLVGGLLRWRVLMVKGTCLYMSARSLKNERMERAKAWYGGRCRAISRIKKSNKNTRP